MTRGGFSISSRKSHFHPGKDKSRKRKELECFGFRFYSLCVNAKLEETLLWGSGKIHMIESDRSGHRYEFAILDRSLGLVCKEI
jgi:hypothetical protein